MNGQETSWVSRIKGNEQIVGVLEGCIYKINDILYSLTHTYNVNPPDVSLLYNEMMSVKEIFDNKLNMLYNQIEEDKRKIGKTI